MPKPVCEICQHPMHKNGTTSAGKTRWRCRRCGASKTRKNNTDARTFKQFTSWLFGKQTMNEMPGGGRTFRRKTSWCWKLWPVSPHCDETHPVVFVDGLYLGRKAVILIAATEKHVIGWYLARTESTAAYQGLLSKIRPPLMVISDGGSGFATALRREWPETKHQRCVVHVVKQVKRYTTSRPRTQAGRELLLLADALYRVKTVKQRDEWLRLWQQWCDGYRIFLEERTILPGGYSVYTHMRLRKARNSVRKVVKDGTLFRFLESGCERFPATNNRIEGAVNAQLRKMLRTHSGLSVDRRIKAVMWWCYFHLERPLPVPELLEFMPRDDQVLDVYQAVGREVERVEGAPGYGEAVVWHELHFSDPYRLGWR